MFEVGIYGIQQGFVFLSNHIAEQIDDFLRTFDIGLEIAQIGVAVTVFLAANLRTGHFFNQHGRTADHFARREIQRIDFSLQCFHVFFQLVGDVFHAVCAFLNPQSVFDAVETGEIRVFGLFFKVVLTRINGGVEFVKQFGNRLDAFVVGTHVGKHRFSLFDFARFHGSDEFFGFFGQRGGFTLDVNLIVGQRLRQFAHIRLSRFGLEAAVGNNQLAARVGQQAASHFISAGQQGNGHFVRQAGSDVFTLVHHHHAFQNFPFQLAAAVVFDVERGFAAGDGQFHRFAGRIVYGNIDAAVGIRCGRLAGRSGVARSGGGGFVGLRRLAGGQAHGQQDG